MNCALEIAKAGISRVIYLFPLPSSSDKTNQAIFETYGITYGPLDKQEDFVGAYRGDLFILEQVMPTYGENGVAAAPDPLPLFTSPPPSPVM